MTRRNGAVFYLLLGDGLNFGVCGNLMDDEGSSVKTPAQALSLREDLLKKAAAALQVIKSHP